MTETLVDILTRTDEDRRLLEQETAILEVTELICKLMEEEKVSKADLAARMGTSKANITQMLDGRRNMTIRTISDLLFHLNHIFKVDVVGVVKDVDERLKSVSAATPRIWKVYLPEDHEQPQWKQKKIDGFRQLPCGYEARRAS
ncbi:MAG TPA: XRE family transcriptional regulator [Phycisphaerae bacterium]|nr:XRE family transcriptional regulator [Phycisphaerae bacterium]